MTQERPSSWSHMLDELARWPDQIAWYDPAGLRLTPIDQQLGIVWLVKQGYATPAGYRVREEIEDTFAITPAGRDLWEREVAGRRRRPGRATPVPRWGTAQMAVALGPRDVWDLARVSWRWNRQAEQDATLGNRLQVKRRL